MIKVKTLIESLPLKYGVTLRRSRPEADVAMRPFVGLERIESFTGRLLGSGPPEQSANFVGDPQQSIAFEPGDVLFGKLRPYLAKAWIANFAGRCTTELLVMTPRAFEARFLRYMCVSSGFINEVDASTFGSKMPRAEWDFIGSCRMSAPPLNRQCAIADYLDRETAKLDSMVAAKERLLDLLNEKRRTLITHAVTRGLNPNAPFRDSGIEWLGRVPKHWIPIRLRWLFKQVKRQDFPDLPLLSVYREYGVIERDSRDDNSNRVPDDLDKYQLVEPGDLVINKMKAWQGSLGIANMRGITSPDYVVFTPLHDQHAAFLNLLLRIPMLATVYLSMSNGIRTNQWRLEPDRFVSLEICLPPKPEQEDIVHHVNDRLVKIDGLSVVAAQSVTMLRERRSALIAAAVNGQLEVES